MPPGHLFRPAPVTAEPVGQVDQRTLPAADHPLEGVNVSSQKLFRWPTRSRRSEMGGLVTAAVAIGLMLFFGAIADKNDKGSFSSAPFPFLSASPR